jgi:hypothetical protein
VRGHQPAIRQAWIASDRRAVDAWRLVLWRGAGGALANVLLFTLRRSFWARLSLFSTLLPLGMICANANAHYRRDKQHGE